MDSLGLSREELEEIGKHEYVRVSDSTNLESTEIQEELSIIAEQRHITEGLIPAFDVLWDRVENRAVLSAVALMISENNKRLVEQLTQLGILRHER